MGGQCAQPDNAAADLFPYHAASERYYDKEHRENSPCGNIVLGSIGYLPAAIFGNRLLHYGSLIGHDLRFEGAGYGFVVNIIIETLYYILALYHLQGAL